MVVLIHNNTNPFPLQFRIFNVPATQTIGDILASNDPLYDSCYYIVMVVMSHYDPCYYLAMVVMTSAII